MIFLNHVPSSPIGQELAGRLAPLLLSWKIPRPSDTITSSWGEVMVMTVKMTAMKAVMMTVMITVMMTVMMTAVTPAILRESWRPGSCGG